MPTGGHGGGSHFGGGFSGGGGSHFGGHGGDPFNSGNLRTRPMRRWFGPTIIHVGGSRYYRSSRTNSIIALLILVCVLSFLFACFAGISLSDDKYKLSEIKQDYEYYQAICDTASLDSNLTTTGTITGVLRNELYGKYYITYTYMASASKIYEGYSFCVYSRSESKQFSVGDSILLAVNESKTDSVPMDYQDMPIERDGEYTYYKSEVRSDIVIIIISIVIFVSSVAVSIIISKKCKKEILNDQEVQISPDKKIYVCPYCGSAKSSGSKCPNCGASYPASSNSINDENKF